MHFKILCYFIFQNAFDLQLSDSLEVEPQTWTWSEPNERRINPETEKITEGTSQKGGMGTSLKTR